MNDVSLPAASRAALAALSAIQSDMNRVQTRLATGKRVNKPMDNPGAFFLAQSLLGRASSLSSLTDSISSAQGVISAANSGIAAIQSLLSTAKGLASSALQYAQTLVTVTGSHSTPFTTSSTIASTSGSSTRLRAGDTVTVSDGTTTATYTAANGDTIQTFLDAINSATGLKVTASLNGNGQLQFNATSNVSVTIGGTLTGTGTLSGVLGLTAGTTSYATNTVRQNLALQFNDLLSQIDQAAKDASFNGVNLLDGSTLSVKFSEDGSSSLSVAGVALSASGLGLSGSSNNWQLDTDINASIDAITSAVNTLKAYAATYSSMSAVIQARADFNSAMIDTLNGGADALTTTDVNEDGALLLALQTRQQIATTALSFVQGANANVLKLFGL
jgi:flagellin-like hook-associated protein FlgL